jgi:hypothetical protein
MSDKIIFEKSKVKNKKYAAILPNGKRVNFGDKRYEQYEDRTPLKLYSKLDHHDKERRKRYYERHDKDYPKYSPDYFSKTYLW